MASNGDRMGGGGYDVGQGGKQKIQDTVVTVGAGKLDNKF